MKTAAERAAEAIRTQSLELLEGRVSATGDMTAIISREYQELERAVEAELNPATSGLESTRANLRSALAKVRGKE